MSGIDWATALPVVFLALMGVAMLAYVVLDGYDLGVGLLLHRATPTQRDTMIARLFLRGARARRHYQRRAPLAIDGAPAG